MHPNHHHACTSTCDQFPCMQVDKLEVASLTITINKACRIKRLVGPDIVRQLLSEVHVGMHHRNSTSLIAVLGTIIIHN